MACATCGQKYKKSMVVHVKKSEEPVIPTFNPNRKQAIKGIIKAPKK